MFITKLSKYLMNEEGGSPGGGAVPPAPPPAPAATGTPAPEPLTADKVASLITEKFTALENALFAKARKSGMLEKDKPAPESPATPAPQPPIATAPASSGLSLADVDALIEQERVLTRTQLEHKLSDAQVKRMKSALKTEKPDDVGTWTTAYLADMGLAKQSDQTSSTTTQTVAVIPNTAPISDRGSPAPNGATGWRYELTSNPMNMSAGAKAAMNAELGEEKARKQRLEAARGQTQRMTVVVNPRG